MLIWWLLPDSYLQCLPVFWVSGCSLDISMWFSQDVSNSAHLNMIVSHLFLTPCYPLFLCLSEWLCHHHPASHQSQTPRAIVDSVPHPSFSVSPQAVPTASEIPSRVLVLSLCIRTTLVRPSPAPWPVSTSFPPGLSASHFATRPPSCPVPLPKHAKAQMKQSPSRVCDLETPCPKFLSKLLSAVLPLHSTLRQFWPPLLLCGSRGFPPCLSTHFPLP